MGRYLGISVLLPLIILASFAFGVWGWAALAGELGLNPVDIAMRALGSMVMATSYEAGPKVIHDWRLETARLLGALAFVLAASQAIARLLSRSASLWFGRFRRNHLLVIGDHPVARGLVQAAADRHAQSPGSPTARSIRHRWQARSSSAASGTVALPKTIAQPAPATAWWPSPTRSARSQQSGICAVQRPERRSP